MPPGVAVIDAAAFDRLCHESGVIVHDEQGRFCVDRAALHELRDQTDARFSFVNGLLWLRPLSRTPYTSRATLDRQASSRTLRALFFSDYDDNVSGAWNLVGYEEAREANPRRSLRFPKDGHTGTL